MTSFQNSIAPLPPNDAAPASFLARPRVRRWGILILILWLALSLRVWQLDTLPPGLHFDEAFNGTMARDVVRGIDRPIFFKDNFGEEPLHMYAEALLFTLVGDSPWAIRLTSAVYGLLLVVAVYACARAFFPRADLLALTATFIAATLYWAINFSRIGIETNSLPPLLTLSAASLAYAYRRMTWRWVIGAGVLLGLTIYTYLASRVWLVAVLLWFAYLCLFHRATIRAHFSRWVVLAVVALITLAPLILFFVANPTALNGRSGTVFTPDTVLHNLARTAAMFSFAGDTDPRDNLVGRPAFDIFLSLFFVVGLLVSLVRFRKPFYGFLLIWLVVMCLPSGLTEFAPNFRRSIGALPAAVLLCAVGVDWGWTWLSARTRSNPILKYAALALLVVALALSAFWSARAYFVDWASGTGLYYSFDAGLLKLGRELAARPADEALYISPDYHEHYTIVWALDGRPISSFDGRNVLVLPKTGQPATYGIITREDNVTVPALADWNVTTTPISAISDENNEPYAQVILVQSDDVLNSDPNTWVRYDGFAELRLYSDGEPNPQRDEPLSVTLGWNVVQPAPHDYTVFVQLVGPTNPATGSTVWAQADAQPGKGTYPTTKWAAGESILEHFNLKLPPEALPGNYQLLTGMYILETGERVPLFRADGTRIENDAFPIHSFTLE